MSLESLGGPRSPSNGRGGPGATQTGVLVGTRLSSPHCRCCPGHHACVAASAGSCPGGWVCLLETRVPKASCQGCQIHGDGLVPSECPLSTQQSRAIALRYTANAPRSTPCPGPRSVTRARDPSSQRAPLPCLWAWWDSPPNLQPHPSWSRPSLMAGSFPQVLARFTDRRAQKLLLT